MEINPNELNIQTWRSGGGGSNWVNKPDDAVRITHIPTGIYGQSDDKRSIHQNKHFAFEDLKNKLKAYYNEALFYVPTEKIQ